MGGVLTFIHTAGGSNEFFHMVITLAGHEVNSIGTMYFDGEAVPLDGSGDATGKYADHVHAENRYLRVIENRCREHTPQISHAGDRKRRALEVFQLRLPGARFGCESLNLGGELINAQPMSTLDDRHQ